VTLTSTWRARIARDGAWLISEESVRLSELNAKKLKTWNSATVVFAPRRTNRRDL
jgi:hypothetical protein